MQAVTSLIPGVVLLPVLRLALGMELSAGLDQRRNKLTSFRWPTRDNSTCPGQDPTKNKKIFKSVKVIKCEKL